MGKGDPEQIRGASSTFKIGGRHSLLDNPHWSTEVAVT